MPIYLRRVLYVVIGIIIFIILSIAIFMGYLQMSTFGIKTIDLSMFPNYIESNGLNMVQKVNEDNYQALVPMKVLNEEVTKQFLASESGNDRVVVSARLYLDDQPSKINYKIAGFFVPVNVKVSHSIVNGLHQIKVIPTTYGEKNINMPSFIDSLFFGKIFDAEIVFNLDIEQYNKSIYFDYVKSEIVPEGLKVDLQLQVPYLDDFLSGMVDKLHPDLVDVYTEGSVNQQEALRWVQEYEENQAEIKSLVFEEYIGDSDVLKELVVLVDPITLKEIYKAYPNLEEKVNRQDVINKRGVLIGDAVLKYTKEILNSLKEYSETGSLVSYRKEIFDLDKMVTIDEVWIKDTFELDIEQRYLDKMDLVVKDNDVYITYDTSEGSYVVANLAGFNVVDEMVYVDDYLTSPSALGGPTTDLEIYNGVSEALDQYFEQKVFIRLLNDDGQEAFAITSLIEAPQELVVVALQKDEAGVFQVLGSGYHAVFQLNQDLKEFNLNITDRVFEEVPMTKLNSNSVNKAIEGLKERGYLSGSETLDYYSYDGSRYIFMELSSGEKYIYTVYRQQVLEDIYTLESALSLFDGINPLIMTYEITE